MKVTSEWFDLKSTAPPLETPILMKHRHGVEAVQFHSARWNYWYTGERVEHAVLSTATHFFNC